MMTIFFSTIIVELLEIGANECRVLSRSRLRSLLIVRRDCRSATSSDTFLSMRVVHNARVSLKISARPISCRALRVHCEIVF